MQMLPDFQLRSEMQPGDLGRITELHGRIYSQEYGWNSTFEAYVAEGLARFVLQNDPEADRIWICEHSERLLGSIAIVGQADHTAQLRWFLLHPEARGAGLGRHLLDLALSFCRERGFDAVFLWTVAGLPASAHLYRSVGFQPTQQLATHSRWGRPVQEQRYDLRLRG